VNFQNRAIREFDTFVERPSELAQGLPFKSDVWERIHSRMPLLHGLIISAQL